MKIMSSQENTSQMISDEHLHQMKLESYSLISRLSEIKMNNYGKCKLFLHDSSKIEYERLQSKSKLTGFQTLQKNMEKSLSTSFRT